MSKLPTFILSIDWETSGSSFGQLEETTRRYQGISFGAVVATLDGLEIVDSTYQEIIFDPKRFAWSEEAERIHGLSQAHLLRHGVTQEQAAIALGSLVLKYFGNTPVICAGHNVQFDVAFTRQLMSTFNCMFDVSHRMLDTSSIGLALFNIKNSDELYEFLGLPVRQHHNALEDAIYTVEALRIIRELSSAMLST